MGAAVSGLEDGGPQFLNVDLDISGRVLDALARSLDEVGCLLQNVKDGDTHRLCFELNVQLDTISETIVRICDLIVALDSPCQQEWRDAEQKAFNVGIQHGNGNRFPVITVSPSVIERIAALEADLVFTHYPDCDSGRPHEHHHLN